MLDQNMMMMISMSCLLILVLALYFWYMNRGGNPYPGMDEAQIRAAEGIPPITPYAAQRHRMTVALEKKLRGMPAAQAEPIIKRDIPGVRVVLEALPNMDNENMPDPGPMYDTVSIEYARGDNQKRVLSLSYFEPKPV